MQVAHLASDESQWVEDRQGAETRVWHVSVSQKNTLFLQICVSVLQIQVTVIPFYTETHNITKVKIFHTIPLLSHSL